MRKALLVIALLLTSMVPFNSNVGLAIETDNRLQHLEYSTTVSGMINLTSLNAPGAVILYDENGTLTNVDSSTPLNLQLPSGNWTLVRMISGVPQLERITFNDNLNVTAFLNTTIQSPLAIGGVAHFDILGPIAQVTEMNATWNSTTSIPNTLGHPDLPDSHLGIMAQIDSQFNGNSTAFSNWLIQNTEIGCCIYDRTEMVNSNSIITPILPSSLLNESWGWSVTSNLTGQGDGRSTRLLWIPITGDLSDRTDLRITLPSPFEIRFSPQEEFISGVPDDFTIHRGDISVTGNLTVALGNNVAPSAYFDAPGRQIPYLPAGQPSYMYAHCDDNTITDPTSRFILRQGESVLLNESTEMLPIDPMFLGLTPNTWLNLTVFCTDSQGLTSNYSVDLYMDGTPPTRILNMQYLHPDDESPIDIEYGQNAFSIPSGSIISGAVQAADQSFSPVAIEWTSNKTFGWIHTATDSMAWNDIFHQGPQVNGQHLTVEDRHQPKPLTAYHLQLNLTDAAGNPSIQMWDVTVTDRTAPMPRPALNVNGQYYGDLNHPIEGGENVEIDLSESWDDIDGITSLTWEVSLNGIPLEIGQTWAEVEHFQLPALLSGRHVLVVNATDSSGNIGSHSSAFVVEPRVGPLYSIVDVVKVGDGAPGDSGALDVTIENAGQGQFEFQLCYVETCTDTLVGVEATVDGPANMTHRIPVEEWSSGEVVIRLEIQDGTVIEHSSGIMIEPEMTVFLWFMLVLPVIVGLGVLWYYGSKQRRQELDDKNA